MKETAVIIFWKNV